MSSDNETWKKFNLNNSNLQEKGRTQQAIVTHKVSIDQKEIKTRIKNSFDKKSDHVIQGGNLDTNHNILYGDLVFSYRASDNETRGFATLNGLDLQRKEHKTSDLFAEQIHLLGVSAQNLESKAWKKALTVYVGGSFNFMNNTGETTYSGDHIMWYLPEWDENNKNKIMTNGFERFPIPTKVYKLQSTYGEIKKMLKDKQINSEDKEEMFDLCFEVIKKLQMKKRQIFAKVLTGSKHGETMTCMFVEHN